MFFETDFISSISPILDNHKIECIYKYDKTKYRLYIYRLKRFIWDI